MEGRVIVKKEGKWNSIEVRDRVKKIRSRAYIETEWKQKMSLCQVPEYS